MSQEQYFQVVPLYNTGPNQSIFTYHSLESPDKGVLVTIPFREATVRGVVLNKTKQPDFSTKAIQDVHEISIPETIINLAKWLSRYYITPLSTTFQALLPSRLDLTASKTAIPSGDFKDPESVALNHQQKQALGKITNSSGRKFLLHGETGSGKTHVYLELARQALHNGQSSLILVPEIALTSHLEQHFKDVFGRRVIVTHSQQTAKTRRNIWQALRQTSQPYIVIGPRSTLFMPVPKPGLVVLDECHENTYKQEQAPAYHAHMVAAKLSDLTNSRLILGSATPGIKEMFLARQDKLELVQMKEPVHASGETALTIVDLRNREQMSNHHFFSKTLRTTLVKTYQDDAQSLLLLNRRGSARLSLCQQCGWVATCPNCQIPLTLHADDGLLRCHWCQHAQSVPGSCPECGQMDIRYLGMGVKRIEEGVKKILPQATIKRLDYDSLQQTDMSQVLKKLASGEIDVLVGTQVVAKGLDVPGIETVGVILADTMLYMPDYTAAEKTFQLIYQVAGRAGRRGGVKNQTIIQTYSPDHPAIIQAANRQYSEFVTRELKERQASNYPPFVYLMKLTIKRKARKSAREKAQQLKNKLNKSPHKSQITILGPAPAFRETLGGNYYWQLIVKAKKRSVLTDLASEVGGDWRIDIDPVDLL